MTTRDSTIHRSAGRRAPFALALAGMAFGVAIGGACAPELDTDPVPAFFEFDPSAAVPRVPLPNIVLVNQQTGLLDYGLPNEPAVCDAITAMPPAMCEFLQFLQTLDGFPTQSTVSVPVSAELDLSTLTASNLAVFALGLERDLVASWNAETSQLVLANPASWRTGRTYVVAIRGYDDGVTTVAGDRVVAPTAYSLLKREESLINCEPDPPDPNDLVNPVVDRNCKYYQLLAEGVDPTDGSALMAVEGTLVDLEKLRQGFLAEGLWEATDLIAQMPKDEVAMVFAFPTHSGPVVELDPDNGKMPEVVDANTLRLAVNGEVDPATLVPHLGPVNPNGTVALLNVTKLTQEPPDVLGGLPTFDATLVDGAIELVTAQPLVPGDRYIVLLATVTPFSEDRPAVRSPDGAPLVPPPPVAALRGVHPVYDDVNGTSNVSVFTAEKAQELETNRIALLELIENPIFPLDRDQIGYVFAFDMAVP